LARREDPAADAVDALPDPLQALTRDPVGGGDEDPTAVDDAGAGLHVVLDALARQLVVAVIEDHAPLPDHVAGLAVQLHAIGQETRGPARDLHVAAGDEEVVGGDLLDPIRQDRDVAIGPHGHGAGRLGGRGERTGEKGAGEEERGRGETSHRCLERPRQKRDPIISTSTGQGSSLPARCLHTSPMRESEPATQTTGLFGERPASARASTGDAASSTRGTAGGTAARSAAGSAPRRSDDATARSAFSGWKLPSMPSRRCATDQPGPAQLILCPSRSRCSTVTDRSRPDTRSGTPTSVARRRSTAIASGACDATTATPARMIAAFSAAIAASVVPSTAW